MKSVAWGFNFIIFQTTVFVKMILAPYSKKKKKSGSAGKFE